MRRTKHVILVLSALGGACEASLAQAPPSVNVAPAAPGDRPFRVGDAQSLADFHAFLEPCRVRARAEWPGIRRRFLQGLPAQRSLFIVTRLRDARARTEQVFIVVDSLRARHIVGRIWSDINTVEGYRHRQPLVLPDSLIVDWMIAHPDGSEEGNRMGKIIDELQAKGALPRNACTR